MPARNVVKYYKEGAYYHIYNRGIDDKVIFQDTQDYDTFVGFLQRHLSKQEFTNSRGEQYESYVGKIELEAYCLMPDHYHLLIYLDNDTRAVTELMRKVSGCYTTYFNKKYSRIGHLFQGVYRASNIADETDVLKISRYIHRDPDDYYNWQYSSLLHYIGDRKTDWVVPDRIYILYDWGTYETYLNQFERKQDEQELVGVLANL